MEEVLVNGNRIIFISSSITIFTSISEVVVVAVKIMIMMRIITTTHQAKQTRDKKIQSKILGMKRVPLLGSFQHSQKKPMFFLGCSYSHERKIENQLCKKCSS